MRKILPIFLLILLACNIASSIPQKISFQGVLKDASGNPVSGNKDITFSIYDVAAGGTAFWNETQTASIEAGLYTVQLGSVTPIPLTTFDGDTRYLGISVDGAELSPRIMMLSVPFAYKSDNSDRLSGHKAGAYGSDTIPITDAMGKLDLSVIPSTGLSGQFVQLGPSTIQSTNAATAVWVRNTADSGFGISCESSGAGGLGIYGGGSLIGIFGDAPSTGVEGKASATSGYGVYGLATGTVGRGVFGKANALGDYANFGGRFEADGNFGYGVFGRSTATGDKMNFGGKFEAEGNLGYGVYGSAISSANTPNYGGFFLSNGGNGYGVYGKVTGSNGRAVNGESVSSNGYSGYFSGGRGVKVYGSAEVTSDFILSGNRTPPSGFSGTEGMIIWGKDAGTNYIYVRTADGWARAPLTVY